MDLLVPTDHRDRLLAALLTEEPGLVLLRWDAEAAILFGVKDPRRIVLMTVPEDLPHDRLSTLFSAHVKTVTQGSPPTHFVAIGGGPEVAKALAEAAPFVEVVAMGFDHIDASGVLAHVKSARLPALERVAAAGIDTSAPLDPAPIAEALAGGQQLLQQERAFAAKLSGRHAVTAAITAACVALAGLGYLWGGSAGYGEALWRMGANEVNAVKGGEVWRLLASAFLHGDGVHLAVNMMALWSLGPLLEAILGPRRYLLLYGASALGGALASAFLSGGARVSVGASGAIWGLMTAVIALALRPKGVIPPPMAAALRRQVWVPLAINLVYSLQGKIDMLAHIGGGVVGFILVGTVLTEGIVPVVERASPTEVERRPRAILSVATAIVVAAMGLSIGAALITGRPWEVGAAPVLQRTAIADTGLTIELPSVAARKPHVSNEDGLQIVSFGTLGELPAAFEIVVTTLPQPVEPGEADALIEELRKQMDDQAPPKWIRTGPAKRIMLGARPAIVVEHDVGKAGAHVKTYRLVIGDRDVLVRGYARKERPTSWQGIEERVAATISGP